MTNKLIDEIRYNLDITYSEISMKGVHLWNR